MVVPPSIGAGSSASAALIRASSDSVTAPTNKSKMPAPAPPSASASASQVPISNLNVPLSARRADPLDLSTVERRGQKNAASEVSKKNRLHNIPEAPTFRPTEEEFKDPMEYMRKISPEGRKYGIVKIIPPDSWNPEFAIDTSRFHFRVRRQELNSVEGGTRANLNYLDQLGKFHKQHGHNLTRFPSVDKRPLDLYKLKKAVEARGGFEKVCKLKKWAEIGRDLGYSGKIMSSLSTSLKNSYQRWLLQYEDYLRLAKPGVQQQLELENGGPFTPSPGTSPFKGSNQVTPVALQEDTQAMRASAALNATINNVITPNGQNVPATPRVEKPESPPAQRVGFTPVNTGGFTAVNSHAPAAGFTAVNGANGNHASPGNGHATPQPGLDIGSPRLSATTTPNFRPVNVEGTSVLKRPLSNGNDEYANGDSDSSGRRSKRLKRDAAHTVAGSNMHHSRNSNPKFASPRDRTNEKPGESCENCGSDDLPNSLVGCESCDCVYHMHCLEPPLKDKPNYDWACPRCLVGTGEFGFEEGEVYSLKAFQERARSFKERHFANKLNFDPVLNSKRPVNEDDVEREFWRLVESLTETVEVEYGADIHSTTHGSGFPTIEKQPRDAYSTDPWNLNVLPLYGESLFRHIKSDISGMTVPWLYVGMVFSTFCWHNEDHFAYSANYHHFGATKTWYGIPAEDTVKFENAMREAVPELFESQPDLLFQLVTLMPPEKLAKAGVRVYAIDQRAGQFVVTYPQAYHAGFNHGFNFNEAVNFAPTDWEPFGAAGVERLRTYRRQPCFSHDELLLMAASRDNTIKTAKWLAPALERMLETELAARKQFLGQPTEMETDNAADEIYRGPRYNEEPIINADDLEEEEYICSYCKAFSFLSRYVCEKSGKVMCLLHAGGYECCDDKESDRYSNATHDHKLYFRLTESALKTTVQKVVDKAAVPAAWAEKVDALLENEPRPQLKNLRTLLNEGERIPYDLPQLHDLRRFVERCNDWVEDATNYITRKSQARRKSEKPGRKSLAKLAEMEERDKELRKLDNIRKLLAAADDISFDCLEINTLKERAANIAEFQRSAREALAMQIHRTTQEYEDLCEIGKTFNVDIPEVDQLEKLVQRLKWNDSARERRGQFQTLQNVADFIQDGLDIGLLETDPNIIYFRDLKQQGELWEAKAKEVMAVEHVHYQQLDALSKQAISLPVTPDTLAQVDSILKKQREAQEKILALYEQSKNPDFRARPMYKDVRDVMAALEELNSKPAGTIDLEREQRRHEDWMRRGKKLFGKTNAPLHILHQHMQIVEARNDGCFDLRDKFRMPVEPSSREHTPQHLKEHPESSTGEKAFPDVFCICRKPEAGMMIECELCHEWYHGRCLKIARGKVKEDDKYTCPICDWRLKIPRDAARPKLEDLQLWQDELETLPFQPEEEQTLANIIDVGQAFRDHIRPYVNPLTVTPEEIGTLRFYLRKVEGADILLGYETNFLRQELHKWAPVAPNPPPVVQHSSSTRKPRPTKQQKLMAQLGISNPDDLPPQYKIKPHSAKRKVTEALAAQRATQPLQPAHGSSQPNTPLHPMHNAGTPSVHPLSSAQTPASQHNEHHTPAFSYDTQTRPMVSSAYRDSPLFAHSSSFSAHAPQHALHNPLQGQPSDHHHQHLASAASFHPRATLNPAEFNATSPHAFSGAHASPPTHFGASNLDPNLDPAMFGPSSGNGGDAALIFDKTDPGAGAGGTAGSGVGSPLGGRDSTVGLDHFFADMVHDEEGAHAADAFAAGGGGAADADGQVKGEGEGEGHVDDGPLDEFINH